MPDSKVHQRRGGGLARWRPEVEEGTGGNTKTVYSEERRMVGGELRNGSSSIN